MDFDKQNEQMLKKGKKLRVSVSFLKPKHSQTRKPKQKIT